MQIVKLTGDVPSYETSLLRIAQESEMVSNGIDTIRGFFPGLLDKLRDSFKIAQDITAITPTNTKEQKFILDNIHNKPYMEIADLFVMVPEGFQGRYVDYAVVLFDAAKNSNKVVEEVLKPFITYLSQFLSNKDAKIGTRSTVAMYLDIDKNRATQTQAIFRFRKEGSVTKRPLGEVIDRKADLNAIYDTHFRLNKAMENINLKMVEDCVKQCVELLNLIVAQVEKGEISNVTPEVTRNLAYGAAECGKEVEYLSFLHAVVIGFNESIDDMNRTLENYVKVG